MLAPRSLSVAVAFILAASALAACYPKAAEVPSAMTPADVAAAAARWPNARPNSLSEGRAAFVASCNGCHSYPDLQSVDEASWPGVVARMGKKAGLDAAASEEVLHFILIARGHAANP